MANNNAFENSSEAKDHQTNHAIDEQKLSTYVHTGAPDLLSEVPQLSEEEAYTNFQVIDQFQTKHDREIPSNENMLQHIAHTSYDWGKHYMRTGLQMANDQFESSVGQTPLPAIFLGTTLCAAGGLIGGTLAGGAHAMTHPHESKPELNDIERDRLTTLKNRTLYQTGFFARRLDNPEIGDEKKYHLSHPPTPCSKI